MYDKERKRPIFQSTNPETQKGVGGGKRAREAWERERKKANVKAEVNGSDMLDTIMLSKHISL
jgi:hypothetical protein